jgi:hypothetical protein
MSGAPTTKPKKHAIPVKRTARQVEAIKQRELGAKAAEEAEAAQTEAMANAAMLAQIVNLTIAGFSYEVIGAQIGMTADEVERLVTEKSTRYIRTQPALRTYVRNWVSGKYTELLDAVWTEATDRDHKEKLENSVQALRILKEMTNLHGAAAPTQAEVKVEQTNDAVEALVRALAAQQGKAYNDAIFDIVPGNVVHQSVADSAARTAIAATAVEDDQPGDEDIHT